MIVEGYVSIQYATTQSGIWIMDKQLMEATLSSLPLGMPQVEMLRLQMTLLTSIVIGL